MNNYYTYAYLREDGTPYYIGKGIGRRIDNPGTHYSGLPPKKRRIILKQNLTEQEAFKHEVYMIFVFGRKDLGTGILRNLTNGGEGKSGWKMSEKTKEKIRKSNIGKKRSPEQKIILSQSHKNKPLSEENKRNISKALKEIGHLPPLHKNTKWWNNGQISKRSVECPGKEWISGRLPLGPYNRKK